MAQSHISLNMKPPDLFTFKPTEWNSWKKRFERYYSLSNLDEAQPKEQVNMLIYCMGEKAEDILASFNLNATESINFQTVLAKFEEYFIPKKNLVFERAKFLKHKQGQSESIENFVTTLHNLAKSCEWGQIYEDMVLMVLITGMRDEALSDRLQLENDLKLETAINLIRKSEELARQKQELNTSNNSEIDRISRNNTSLNSSHSQQNNQNRRTNLLQNSNKERLRYSCWWCGSDSRHSRKFCPAKNNTCSKCQKIGHFPQVCKSGNVQNVESNSQSWEEDYSHENSSLTNADYISTVQNQPTLKPKDPWLINLKVNDTENITFKIDTGADVSILPSHLVESKNIRIQPTTQILTGASGNKLTLLGKATLKLSYKEKVCYETVYISVGSSQPLLGKPAIENLQLVARIDTIQNSSSNHWINRHAKLFRGLGSVPGKYKVELKPDAQPYAINTPRRVPLPLWQATKDELKSMMDMGVITTVTHATDWCAPMVVVPKRNSNKIRICVDLSNLNKSVKRRYYPIQPIDTTLARISGASVFSKLDANHGFWQINLDEESQDLTTFLTPFGRYKFLKLPFGISSAPEVFQEYVNRTLQGQRNAAAHMDDVIVWGKDQQEHDTILEEVLTKLENAGFTLNKDKTVFSQKSTTYLGHRLTAGRIMIDDEKVAAITEMSPPVDIAGIQRFLGMVNFVGKFIPNKSEVLKPITELLSKKHDWFWGNSQQRAFEQIKTLLTSAPQLAFYDISRPTMISADSSLNGLGGVLLQQQTDQTWKPISYISRTITPSEKNYSNIEREALAITWSCDKFKDYIVGKDIVIETDHKPLTTILTSKELNDLTPRLQRLRIRLMVYSYTVVYTPGKHLATADCLSRSPITNKDKYDLEEEIEHIVHAVTTSFATSDSNIQKTYTAQQSSPTFRKLEEYCQTGWPDKSKLQSDIMPYYPVHNEISICDGLLVKKNLLIIPEELRQEMLNRIHSAGHFGINKCRQRASNSMWWPGIYYDIEKHVTNCSRCIEFRPQHHEPLIPSKFPSRPWEQLSIDLFKLDGSWYVILFDQYSRYLEVATLKTLTTSEVIDKCKSVFSRHGIPYELHSDCGTQFAAQTNCLENAEFKKFTKEYNFKLVTSSPGHHQSNGSAEAGVKIAKNILRKGGDPYMGLLAYRNTPITSNGLSPAQLLFKRMLRDNLPVHPDTLNRLPNMSQLKEKEDTYRASYKAAYDTRHGAKILTPLKVGQSVWIRDLKRRGEIVALAQEPRSYWVKTDQRTVRRNRYHLMPYNNTSIQNKTPVPFLHLDVNRNPTTPPRENDQNRARGTDNQEFQQPQTIDSRKDDTPPTGYRTRFGRKVKPLERYH
jgi:predicted aspartyl protease